jgi:hypothetical protein
MALVIGGRSLLVMLGRRAPGPRFFFQGTVALWFVGIFLALSWAGEKMPWLIIHITLPGTLLGAAAVGGFIERWLGRSIGPIRADGGLAGAPVAAEMPWVSRGSEGHPLAGNGDPGQKPDPSVLDRDAVLPAAGETVHHPSDGGPSDALHGVDGRRLDPFPIVAGRGWGAPEWWTASALLALAAGWFLLAGRLTYGEFIPSTLPGGWERTVTPEALRWWWLLAVPPVAALAVLLVAWAQRGLRRAGAALLAATLGLLTLFQIHAGWRLAYLEGDVPKDMLVYTQTAPDVHRMTTELTRLSEEITGGTGLEIWYDDNDGVSWPMQWYLRDFPNRNLFGRSLTEPPDVPVLLVADGNDARVRPSWMATPRRSTCSAGGSRRIRSTATSRSPRSCRRPAPPGATPPTRATCWPSSARSADSLAQLLTPEGQQRLYRLAVYRDLPARIDSYNYTLYVRDDLVDEFNAIRYG